MAVELEAPGFGGRHQPVEMLVEVRDAVVRVETHDLFEVGRPLHSPPCFAGRVAFRNPLLDCAVAKLFVSGRP